MTPLPSPARVPADDIPAVSFDALPALTAADMAEVDRLAIDVFGISLLQMMEQAGSHLAELAAVRARRRSCASAACWWPSVPATTAVAGWSQRGTWSTVAHACEWCWLARHGGSPRPAATSWPRCWRWACRAAWPSTTSPMPRSTTELARGRPRHRRGPGLSRSRCSPRRGRPRSSSASRAAHGRILSLDLPSGLDADSGAGRSGAIRSARPPR